MGSLQSDTTEWLHFHFSLSCIGEGHGKPLQCSCLENPRDGEAWWAAIYGVAQSRTRLKQLSSSSPFTVETWHPAHLATGPCDWCVHDWTQEPVLSLQLHLSTTTPLTDPRRPSWQPVNNDGTLILSGGLHANLLSRGHRRCGERASHTRLQVPTVVLNGQGLRTVFHLHCWAPSCRLACVHWPMVYLVGPWVI